MNPFNKTLVLFFAVLALFASIPLQSAEADLLREIKDREEIDQLLWRYTRALDSFDPDAYVATYTEDGSFGAVKGHEALHAMMVDFRNGRELQAAEGNPPAPMFHAT